MALAVAIANRPTILLADEVVAQLDAETAGARIDEVLSVDIAVLYITHDLALADRVTTRYELADHKVLHAMTNPAGNSVQARDLIVEYRTPEQPCTL